MSKFVQNYNMTKFYKIWVNNHDTIWLGRAAHKLIRFARYHIFDGIVTWSLITQNLCRSQCKIRSPKNYHATWLQFLWFLSYSISNLISKTKFGVKLNPYYMSKRFYQMDHPNSASRYIKPSFNTCYSFAPTKLLSQILRKFLWKWKRP